MLRRLCLSASIFIGNLSPVFAATATPAPVVGPAKVSLWDIELTAMQYRWKGYGFKDPTSDNDVVGKGAVLSLGYGQTLGEASWWQARLDLFSGPWEHIRNATFDADYSGTGVSMEIARAIWPGQLRGTSGTIAGVLAVGYTDMAGRSIGRNRAESLILDDRANYYLEQNYIVSVNALWMEPQIAWVKMLPTRPDGNSLELLDTRIEGYALSLGAVIPVYATYRAYSVRRKEEQSTSQAPGEYRETGLLRGYAVAITLRTWLGT